MSHATDIDNNLRSIYGEIGTVHVGIALVARSGDGIDSYLKVSACEDVTVLEVDVPQGEENALDINNCHGVTVRGEFGHIAARGDQVITLKASTGCTVSGGVKTVVTSRNAHVQVGNWSDQSQRMCRGNRIELWHQYGGKVKVAIGWAMPFSTRLGEGCEYLVWESIKLKAYWITKYVVRLVLRVRKGERGPKWL